MIAESTRFRQIGEFGVVADNVLDKITVFVFGTVRFQLGNVGQNTGIFLPVDSVDHIRIRACRAVVTELGFVAVGRVFHLSVVQFVGCESVQRDGGLRYLAAVLSGNGDGRAIGLAAVSK